MLFLTFFIAIDFIWLGMVLAISFLEAPVKFSTPSLTRPVALDVGRIVFTAFHWAQGGLFIASFILLIAMRTLSLKLVIPYSFLIGLLIAQSFWLLPALSYRAVAILQGLTLPDSPVHIIYVVLEGLKVILLIWLGIMALLKLQAL